MWNEVCEEYNFDEIYKKKIVNDSKCVMVKVKFRIPFTWYFLVKVKRFDMVKLMLATKEFDVANGEYYFQII